MAQKETWLEELNDEQRKAVTYESGPLFVVAGAGTGKTKTLTSRIGYLIKYKNIEPYNILAVTFTNKAAREMKERLLDMVGPHAEGTTISTFHSFGLKVLRKFIEELPYGLTSNFSVIDDEDSKKIIKDVTKELNLDAKEYPLRFMRNFISNYKTKRETFIEDDNYERIFQAYKKYLLKNNLLDFDDLLIYTHELLDQSEKTRTYLQTRYTQILVDEFQDTDKIQYAIISIMASLHKNLFVVGDPDQSIYSFRGADYENTKKFLNEFGNQHILDLNYRSTNKILSKANKLIKHNQVRPFEKDLKSDLGEGSDIIYMPSDSDYRESAMVVNEIRRLIASGSYQYEDIAILYRNNSLSRHFEDALIQMGLPYVIYGGISFYERLEIKDILAYVRVILNPHQDFYVKRIINTPKRQIGLTTISKLEQHAHETGLSMFDAIESLDVNKPTKERLLTFKNLIKDLRLKLEQIDKLKEIVMMVFKETGYQQMLIDEKDDVATERMENIKELSSVFYQADFIYKGSIIEKTIQLLDQIALYTDLDKKDSDGDVIKLSTYHQVKGLEFKVVFMVAMEEGIFPSSHSNYNPEELEEERRIAYVGVTRAKEKLYLSYAYQRVLYGQFLDQTPSRFIKEMGLLETKKEPSVAQKTYQETNTQLKPSDKVSHTVFGNGVVITVDGDIATIAFPMPHGLKKLIQTHPSIKKI
mgnify:FL=1